MGDADRGARQPPQPKTSTAEARKELLDEAMKGTNEARAELMSESDVRAVFDEFDRVREAYLNWSAIKDGVARSEELIDAHCGASSSRSSTARTSLASGST